MTTIDTKQAQARDWAADRVICDNATDGADVWKADGKSVVQFDYYNGEWYPLFYGELDTEADARFIAEARTGWPAALDRIAELEAENERLQSRVDKLDGYNEFNTQYITELSSEIQRYRQALEFIAKAGPHIFVRQIAKEALEYGEVEN